MPTKPDNYLDTVFNTLNEAVFVYDQNMEIKYFNAAAEKDHRPPQSGRPRQKMHHPVR